jgi:hypothetical protein
MGWLATPILAKGATLLTGLGWPKPPHEGWFGHPMAKKKKKNDQEPMGVVRPPPRAKIFDHFFFYHGHPRPVKRVPESPLFFFFFFLFSIFF